MKRQLVAFRRHALGLALLLQASVGSSVLASSGPQLVADLNPSFPGPDRFGGWAGPTAFLALGSQTVFTYREPSSGAELWVTDGTPAGTKLVIDLCPGSGSTHLGALAVAGRIGFFEIGLVGENCAPLNGLWRTDGTAAGTYRIHDDVDLPFLGEHQYAVVGSNFFFQVCHGGCELWKTDGTQGGTVPLADIGLDDNGDPPRWIVGADNQVFFFSGGDLWRSDGTAVGTTMVKNFPQGIADFPTDGRFAALGSRLFFVAPQDGDELWVSDGTSKGTRVLTDITAPHPFGITQLNALGGEVYFLADDVIGGVDLWKSDGSVSGTHRVTDFGYASPFVFADRPSIATLGGHVFFVANDGLHGPQLWISEGWPETTRALAHPQQVPENAPLFARGGRVLFPVEDGRGRVTLWGSDGTDGGTLALKVVCSFCPSNAFRGRAALDRLFFYVGPSLWVSDGTSAGTRALVAPLRPISDPGSVFGASVSSNRILFGAEDDEHGAQLWTSDGTRDGTALVTLVGLGGLSSYPSGMVALGERGVFAACDESTEKVWRIDGTQVSAFDARFDGCGEGAIRPVVIGQRVFLLAGQNSQQRVWTTDGVAPLVRILVAPLGARGLREFKGKALFWLEEDERTTFWSSDGTEAGTQPLFTSPARSVRDVTPLGAEFFFVAQADTGDEVFRSDGTAEGTRAITNREDFYLAESPGFVRVGSDLFFRARDRSDGVTLWRSNGSLQGTGRALQPSAIAGLVDNLRAIGDSLFFTSVLADNYEARALYRLAANSTEPQLVAVVRLEYDYAELDLAGPVPLGDSLIFAAEDPVHGLELWRASLGGANAEMIKDVTPGPSSSSPSSLTAANGRLFFTAHDGRHGFELWESDGTAAGTRMVQDIAPGAVSSSPRELAQVGNALFFSADDGIYGRELWTLPLEAALPPCVPSTRRLCLAAGRYQVEAFWRDFAANTGPGTAVGLTADTGYFWFFDPSNVEVILKVLDGTGLNGHRWVFYGALSSVEYSLTVTDTQTGAARRYVNPPGALASVGDTSAFGPNGATPSAASVGPRGASYTPLVEASHGVAAASVCSASATRLCLNGGRFAVEVAWKDFQGHTGVGTAGSLTGDTGYFWFFDATNVEVVAKVLDGRSLNNKFWVFYGALSSVEYTLTVTDTLTGDIKTYKNPSGRLASVADTSAF
jgi:ELWxxDGT repeat protein